MPQLKLINLFQIIPYLLIILLHCQHLLPLLLSYIFYFLYGHDAYLFDLVVDLLDVEGLVFDHDGGVVLEEGLELALSGLFAEDGVVVLVY